MKMNFSLRPATSSDLDAILLLFTSTIRHTCSNDYTPAQIEAWIAGAENTERWKKAINKQYFLLAEMAGQIVGFGSLADGHCIDFLYVHHEHLRKGIAQKLYDALETETRKVGTLKLRSDVSITARPFFEKQGFKVIRKNRNQRNGDVLINFRMEKGLQRSDT